MRRSNAPSWRIACDFPEDLQFAAYIGQQEQFSLASDAPPRDAAERAWRVWWEALPHWLEERDMQAQQMERATPPVSAQEQMRQIGALYTARYDPPDFASLAATPALRDLCRQHWPVFQMLWSPPGGEKMVLATMLGDQLRNVALNRMVRDCARVAGKRESAPFLLRIDFTRWPADYLRVLSNTHIMLGAGYLAAARMADFAGLLREYVALLV
ncbi:MAG: hypothetical protein OJF49_002252 [Ktedonobacterales bacterium]|jgi:hypothetical protein|nr:MAG: hypothetical protein OJF49_002252 [Ktedonobacterales bacterium]